MHALLVRLIKVHSHCLLISLLHQKADFVGKAAVQKVKDEGIKHKLVLLTMPDTDNVDPEGNETIWLNDKVRFMRPLRQASQPIQVKNIIHKRRIKLIAKHG